MSHILVNCKLVFLKFTGGLDPVISNSTRHCPRGFLRCPALLMRQLITRLSRSSLLRRGVQLLRLNRLGNAWLKRFPFVKKLPGSGVIYRATRLESIPLAVEMFEKGNLYDATLLRTAFINPVSRSGPELVCSFTCCMISSSWVENPALERTI